MHTLPPELAALAAAAASNFSVTSMVMVKME